ncbi:MAG: two-component system, OmpR family, phosphate regulon sensor histidine kinase PhoR, partial [Chloroflexota bacterium]|nr:two-component system, OmpR family, phosphate regulon sensor histidine kinase PhoR [Chloroflexota bacterium]
MKIGLAEYESGVAAGMEGKSGGFDIKPRQLAPRLQNMLNKSLELLTGKQTYLRIAYLLLAFPLGTLYFIVIVTGLATGFGTAIVIVGFPLLVLTLLVWLLFAHIERGLAVHLLGARLRPMSITDPTSRTIRDRLMRTLANPVTWKSLAYLLLEFPFGVFTFTLGVILIMVSVSLVLYPLVYWALTWLYQLYPGSFQGTLFPGVTVDGHLRMSVLIGFLAVSVFGLFFATGSAAVLNGLGWLWARFAEVMLGVDESRLLLDAAAAETQTQRARAERSDQSRRELIVNASHELRTPVASISAHVESLLKPGRAIDDETRRYLTVVATETERLGSLVDDVLVLARADADELHLDIRAVAIPALVDDVCDALAPLARRERNLNLVHSSAPGLRRAMADRDRLGQVLGNLIRNAVNHTPEGGIISVEASDSGDRVTVAVSDTGIGMEPGEVALIFDRFYRSDQSR